jgi:general secretion pathway protein G
MRIRTEQTKQSSSRPSRLAAGFTLLEMVIVLGIIALLLGGAVAVVGPKILNSAKYTKVDGDFQGYKSAFMTYRNMSGYYPTTQQGFKALVDKPSSPPVPRRWNRLLDSVPLDPWGNEYGYRYPGSKDPNEPEFISRGPDGQENTDDDISSQD